MLININFVIKKNVNILSDRKKLSKINQSYNTEKKVILLLLKEPNIEAF